MLLKKIAILKLVSANVLVLGLIVEVSLRLGLMEIINSIETGEINHVTQVELEYLSDTTPYVRERNWNIPHPFFGFGPAGKNHNLRFENDEHYVRRNPNENVLAIFGGSVANNLFNQGPLGNSIRVSEELRIQVGRVLNFSIPGGRQPQSLNIASVFGQSYNIAINIEGRNEMNGPNSSLFPPYFPNAAGASNLYFGRVESLAKIGEIKRLMDRNDNHTAQYEKTKDGLIRVIPAFHQLMSKLTGRKIVEMANGLSNLDGRGRFQAEELYDAKNRLAMWVRFSCLQQNIQYSMGTSSFFVIQPVPQFYKILSEEEKRLILNDDWERRYQNYLPVTELKISHLSQAGLTIIDLSQIFKNTKDTVYTDSCCHLNSSGNEIFFSEMFNKVRESIERQGLGPKLCRLEEVERILEMNQRSQQ